MIRLSAFADEISPDPEEQVRVLLEHDVRAVDLRGAWGTNVLDLTDRQIGDLIQIFRASDIRVAAIASPIGKSSIDAERGFEYGRLRRAIDIAHRCDTTTIRVFSFYGLETGPYGHQAAMRDEVIERLREMARVASTEDVLLVHENEKEIYGDTVERCLDLLQAVNSPAFGAAFDPANFIQCGETPYPDGYDTLREWIGYVHVKDATAAGDVVPAGEGAAQFPQLLRRLKADGYAGVFALEPHLAAQGRQSGFSGPDLFGIAAGSLQRLLKEVEWAYE
jgi:3-dehydroshikimate dehydratase